MANPYNSQTLSIVPIIGRQTTTMTFTPFTVSSLGVVTAGTPVSLLGQLNGIQFDVDPEHEEISSATSPRRNMCVISDGISASCDFIKAQAVNGSVIDPQKFLSSIVSSDYFSIDWVEGVVSGSIQTASIFGVRGKVSGGAAQGKGKQGGTFEILPADPGISNLSRTVS